jgi:transcriptional regulator with XRE-family HTH domain
LAHRADLDRTYISSLERNVYSATIDVLDRLAVALSVEPGALLDRSLPDFKEMPPAKSGPTDEIGWPGRLTVHCWWTQTTVRRSACVSTRP